MVPSHSWHVGVEALPIAHESIYYLSYGSFVLASRKSGSTGHANLTQSVQMGDHQMCKSINNLNIVF